MPDLRPAGVPNAVARVVEVSMAKEPAGRPTSAADLARQLGDAAQAAGVDVGAAGTPAAGPAAEAKARTVAQPQAAPAPAPPTPSFTVTHVVPRKGLPAWATPDPTHPAVATLDPGLGVQLIAWWGEWAHIRCSNGWEAWVNGRLLIPR